MPDDPHVPRRKTIGSDHAAKYSSRECNKKRRRETRDGFSSKRKAYALRGDSTLENDD
jgi:hypothetical protein